MNERADQNLENNTTEHEVRTNDQGLTISRSKFPHTMFYGR